MLHHVVLFQLEPAIDAATLDASIAEFAGLAAHIQEIVQIDVRRDVLPPDARRPVSSHFGLLGQFADLQALKRYQQHPLHVAALDRLRPHIAQMLVLDYEA